MPLRMPTDIHCVCRRWVRWAASVLGAYGVRGLRETDEKEAVPLPGSAGVEPDGCGGMSNGDCEN